ncbi:hypothetical protein RFI_35389 [Reticulomyxa filosa]|uniref:Uncharacterized protein n=1 Tax=Reticulomyxa filosa TaxID=46433 RepID=X6LKZ9_RETFI|nr:hypothetical protein RFI_35389 [Reticulomyxa filosa]|eukprot:ETO02046.1 hypothetical protein RFI_35389 [Reticulomyxa filosa]
MPTFSNEKKNLKQLSLIKFVSFFQSELSRKEEIQIIIQHWIRILDIKLGWIPDFDKLVIKYVMFFAVTAFLIDTFCPSSTLLKAFTLHKDCVNSIDYSIFDNFQLICFGSDYKTVRVLILKLQANSIIQYIRSCICVTFSISLSKQFNNMSFFLSLRKKAKNSQQKSNGDFNANLYLLFRRFCSYLWVNTHLI